MTATSQHTARVELTVGQVAESFGVTVRTLHHYDAEGLVVPSTRTHAGYRLYTDADLTRLATVVTYRRLGMPLDEVRALLDGVGTLEEHLRRQRHAVVSRLGELEELVTAIDRALEREMEGRPATTEELKELFGDGFREEYQAEAQERWGETDAWKQSASRTSRRAWRHTCTTRSTPTPTGTSGPDDPGRLERRQHAGRGPSPSACCLLP